MPATGVAKVLPVARLTAYLLCSVRGCLRGPPDPGLLPCDCLKPCTPIPWVAPPSQPQLPGSCSGDLGPTTMSTEEMPLSTNPVLLHAFR